MKEPAGTTTISGQLRHSLNIAPGFATAAPDDCSGRRPGRWTPSFRADRSSATSLSWASATASTLRVGAK